MSKPITLPGLIDCHVHFREPGLEQKGTMKTEAAAARAGGVTTVCEMPNTIPPTVTVAALADKVRRADALRSAQGDNFIDIHFFFGATEEAHLHTLRELWTGSSAELQRLKKRCCGLKLYLDHSTGDQKAPAGVIDQAFAMCAELGIVTVCHCEDSEMNQKAKSGLSGRNDMEAHSEMRPPESEAKSIKEALALAKKHGTHLHVAHLSTAQGIELVRQAKKDGITVTCEVAPHHLFLTVDDYQHLGAYGKMNPPLRTRDHQEALWQGIADRTVDCISTDHAPHTKQEKDVTLSSTKGDITKIPSGVPGVETMLPLLLTVVNGKWPNPHDNEWKIVNGKWKIPSSIFHFPFSISDIIRLCFENPNRIFNLGKDRTETIAVDLEAEWTIKAADLHSKCGWTPYEGWKVMGKVLESSHL
jgi:dihydroorotase